MVARGTVKGGVVVLDAGSGFREGDAVAVFPLSPVPPTIQARTAGHRILDIPTVSLGAMLKPLSPEDDLLGEMLEDRQ